MKKLGEPLNFKVIDDCMTLKFNYKAWTGDHSKEEWVRAATLLRFLSGQLLSLILYSVQPTMRAEGSMVNSVIT